jgi:4-alpha-glucanotransferase
VHDDAAVRPNQLFALAARHSPLPEAWRASALARVRALLATPLAVRTLPTAASEYRGRYEGDQRSRDYAYHQGTAWPFLAGLLLDAERMAYPARAEAFASTLLGDLADHLGDAGLGSVSEVVDGDAPHEPRGCPMQAWSVACLLDALRAALPREPAR